MDPQNMTLVFRAASKCLTHHSSVDSPEGNAFELHKWAVLSLIDNFAYKGSRYYPCYYVYLMLVIFLP